MKIEGYTLIEMLVVLALTGVAMAISWGVYAQFRLYGQELQLRQDRTRSELLADAFLSRDLREADSVQVRGDSLKIFGARATRWRATEKGLHRQEGSHRDSFDLPNGRFRLEAEALQFQYGDSVENPRTFHHRIFRRPTAKSSLKNE